MTPTFSDDRTCLRCNRSHADAGYTPVHEPVYSDDQPRRPQPEPPTDMPMPFDPVLRQALLSKGIITLDDLTRAERMIRATTGQLLAEVGDVTADR